MEEPKIELFKVTLADGTELPPVASLVAHLDLELDPSPVLRQRAEEVDVSTLPNDDMGEFVAKMIFTMYSNGGIGLAAPQVGVSKRVIVLDHLWGQEKKLAPSVLINPEVVDAYDEATIHEGCLSVGAHYYTDIKRAFGVEVTGVDIHGEPVNLVAEGLLAAVLQHEIDHLNGKLFIDYVGRNRRLLLEGKKRKLKRQAKRIAKHMKKG